ncbi:MAG: hypothetical protein E6Y83_00470 [Clostridium butyricum]|nr:hypothetical protein [Clostridium butyricum]
MYNDIYENKYGFRKYKERMNRFFNKKIFLCMKPNEYERRNNKLYYSNVRKYDSSKNIGLDVRA